MRQFGRHLGLKVAIYEKQQRQKKSSVGGSGRKEGLGGVQENRVDLKKTLNTEAISFIPVRASRLATYPGGCTGDSKGNGKRRGRSYLLPGSPRRKKPKKGGSSFLVFTGGLKTSG